MTYLLNKKNSQAKFLLIIIGLLIIGGSMAIAQSDFTNLKTVIAHRGASGYLPEHSLEAIAMAHPMNPDYIEPDIVLTKDSQAIVLHDIHLDTTTNVAELFPDRKRNDGRYYAIDFSLAEIKTLSVHERIDIRTGKRVFPDRFPIVGSEFKIPTLREEIELIQGLNKSRNIDIGIYPEIKEPEFHNNEGKDISKIVLDILADYGYKDKEDKVFLQCFDLNELKRIRSELGARLELIYLLNSRGVSSLNNASDAELKTLSEVVDGLGVSINGLLRNQNKSKESLAKLHELGLVVHGWTVRKDSLPSAFKDIESLLIKLDELGVDGVFTDFSDLVIKIIK